MGNSCSCKKLTAVSLRMPCSSDGNWLTTTPRFAHTQNTMHKTKSFCFHSGGPSLLTLAAWSLALSHGQHKWTPGCVSKSLLGRFRLFLSEVYWYNAHQRFLMRGCLFLYKSQKKKKFPKLKWKMFAVFLFLKGLEI